MIPRLFLQILIITYGVALPVYWSHKALKNSNEKQIQEWLTYWIIFSLFAKFLDLSSYVIGFWLPFYNELVLLTLFWLISPHFNGSKFLYDNYLKPALSNYENKIDSSLEKTWKNFLDVGLRVSVNTAKLVINATVKFLKEGNFTDFKDKSLLDRDENGKLRDFNVFQNFLDSEGLSSKIDAIDDAKRSSGDGNQVCEKESLDDIIINHPKTKHKLCKKNKAFKRSMLARKAQDKILD
ncbi:uncharacterized protein T19C3.4 [Trichonephila clavata]|uniref:Receptor expression-enhancing protein n=1 Tax=Trichonephila clavata TaxID=2740835 RepID=A0A8X6JDQ3_TRICU|nr:uncharacterized protein T19C3.4 [Trichonephila clavata]